MAEGCIYIYTGDGRGKSPAAIGRAVQAAVEGKRVVIIQFLKGNERRELDFLEELDQLDIKIFGFPAQDGTGDQIVPFRKIGQQFCRIA